MTIVSVRTPSWPRLCDEGQRYALGTTISFYTVGLAVLLIWRGFVARAIGGALRSGAFANARAIVIAEAGLPASSNAVTELVQHGYRLIRIKEIRAKVAASPLSLLLSQIVLQFEELIAYAREHRIEQVFMQIRRDTERVLRELEEIPLNEFRPYLPLNAYICLL
jgi:undecaprenyl-phosphate galactose phosphotransferase/putative colanic acid biosynthesis UDP-glucose lipid carrier transferase